MNKILGIVPDDIIIFSQILRNGKFSFEILRHTKLNLGFWNTLSINLHTFLSALLVEIEILFLSSWYALI